jgi:hypothetical protein
VGAVSDELHTRGRAYVGMGLPPVNEAEARHRAVRWIASEARDAGDCALLLDALGLTPQEGKADA